MVKAELIGEIREFGAGYTDLFKKNNNIKLIGCIEDTRNFGQDKKKTSCTWAWFDWKENKTEEIEVLYKWHWLIEDINVEWVSVNANRGIN